MASSSADVDQMIKQAAAAHEQGMAALRAGDLEKAVDHLGSALEKRVSMYGELAPECAFAYFKYGSALFFKSQEEADVLGSASTGKLAATDGSQCAAGQAGKEEAEEDAEEEADDEEDEEGGEENLEEGGGAEGEDEGDQALAWQVLETARCIYAKMPERSLDEADVIMTLADISLEKEDFAACVEDYQRAILMLHSLLPPHSRRLAEGYFRLALAHQTAQQPVEALDACRRAIDICTACVAKLEGSLAGTDGSSLAAPDPAPDRTPEVGSSDGNKGPAAGSSVGGPPEPEQPAETEPRNGDAEVGTVFARGQDLPEGIKPAVNEEGSASGPRSSSTARCSSEEIAKEIAEVEAIIADLREKESELQETLAEPSFKHLLPGLDQKQHAQLAAAATAAAAAGEGAAAVQATVAAAATAGHPECNEVPVVCNGAPHGGPAVGTRCSNSTAIQGHVEHTPVAVVGRGTKRAAPTPVEPSYLETCKPLRLS